MNKLKGSGSTFSTSGKRWKPFRYSPAVAKQNAKRHRLVRSGLAGGLTKEQMRPLATSAASTHKPRTIAAGKRTRHDAT